MPVLTNINPQMEHEQLERTNPFKLKVMSQLFKAYADMEVFIDYHGTSYFASKTCNPLMSQVVIETDGDEGKTNLYLWPHAWVHEDEWNAIHAMHSSPPCFLLGWMNDTGTGIMPNVNLKEQLTEAGISESIWTKAEDYLAQHRPIHY